MRFETPAAGSKVGGVLLLEPGSYWFSRSSNV